MHLESKPGGEAARNRLLTDAQDMAAVLEVHRRHFGCTQVRGPGFRPSDEILPFPL